MAHIPPVFNLLEFRVQQLSDFAGAPEQQRHFKLHTHVPRPILRDRKIAICYNPVLFLGDRSPNVPKTTLFLADIAPSLDAPGKFRKITIRGALVSIFAQAI